MLYRTGPNSYEDGYGNPVQIGPGMKVSGYQPSSAGGTSSGAGQGPADPGAPVSPVNPDPAPAEPVPAPVDPVEPDPIDPFELP